MVLYAGELPEVDPCTTIPPPKLLPVAYVVYVVGVAESAGLVLAITRYPVDPFGVKLIVAPLEVTPEKVSPVGCVVGATAAGLLTSKGTFTEHVPVL